MTQTNTGNLPVAKFSAGPITATVWKNTGQKEGREYEFSTLSLERKYKDKEDQWQSTNSLRVNDLPRAVIVLNKAFEHLVLKDQTQAA